MKVTEYVATDTNVTISIEPEHPAEIALFKQPKDGALITAVVKKSRY